MKFHTVVKTALMACVITLTPLVAQDMRGTILGRVTDPTGATVAGAKVEAVNADTGAHSATTSNSAGDYILTYLLPGSWNLTVENAGFKSATRQGITLRDGSRVSTDIRLEVGDTRQTVQVEATAPLLDTSTASLGQSFDQREIRDLPTKDGMVLMVATLAPGVTFTPQSAGYVRPFDTGSPSSMSVNGTRPGSNEFQVDGTPNLQGGQIAYSPPQAVVGELKVQTSSFDASTGFNTGAVMNMTIKSGTNALHGSVEYFMQNPVLNADNFFRLSTGKPGFRIHRYGASATGPVVLPKIYDGKNRTFFTYGFEGIWSFDPSPWVVEAVPTAAQRTGDLSALLKVNPSYQIYDPYSTTPVSGGRFQRNPVPNNIIPPSRIDPVSAKIAKLWDQPNQIGNADGLNNYTKGKNAQDTYDNNLVRIDHNISDRQRMYGRYNQTALERPENIRQNLTVGDNFYRYNHGAALDHVFIASPSFIIDSRYSFMRFTTGYLPYQQGWDLAGLGFNQSFLNQVTGIDPRALKFPTINTSPFSQLGGVNNNNRQIYMTHEGAVSLTNIFGRHTVRSGVTFRELLQNSYNLGASSGSFNFDSTYTNGPFNTSGSAPIGQEFASFLYGLPGSGSFPINDNFAEKTRYFALYAQDDWKLSTKLTISAGLRYELPSPLTERFNRSVKGFDATATQSINGQVLANYAQNPIPQVPVSAFRLNGGLTFAGSGGLDRGLWSTTFKNLMPRIGIAYSLTPTTVIRTGYGIYYSPLGITSVDVNQTGFSSSTAYVGSVDNGQTYVASLSNPFPNGFTRASGAAGGASTFLGQNVTFFDQNLRNPYAQRWQFALQHQFPSNILVEGSYVGNRGTRLTASQDRNPIPGQYLSTLATRDQTVINGLSAVVPNPFYPLLPRTNLSAATIPLSQLLKPFPQFSGVTELTNAGSSWYHALQARANKRFSKGLSVNYSFTWSKFMEATTYLNPFDTRPEHVISDQDRPFRSVVTVMYELPFGKGKAFGSSTNAFVSRAIGGWQLQGIYSNQSGQALGFGNAILTCPLDQISVSDPTIGQWFNTSCFNRVANQQLASNVRTVSTRFSGIRGPGLNNVDLSFIKNTQITEKLRLQFHAQAINALNHPQFSNPGTSPTSTALGQVTGTFSWQRIVEFGMRVIF